MNIAHTAQRLGAIQQVKAAIAALGWKAIDSTAIASKVFATAVGDKTAHVYLQDFGPESTGFMLHGDYQSEGRNILESQCVLIPKGSDDEQMRRLVAKFVQNAERAVAGSYAVRLLRTAEAA